MRTPRNLSTTAIATIAGLVGGMVASFGPGLAQAAYDAVNSDKVDGLHAVGAGASVDNRKGKLVATNGSTGRLPNNIIAKAPDSAKLGGKTHEQMRAISLPVQGVVLSGNAILYQDGVNLQQAGEGGFSAGFVLPPDYTAGAPLKMDLIYQESSSGACSFHVQVVGLEGPDGDNGPVRGEIHNGGWYLPGINNYQGEVSVPSGADYAFTSTFSWLSPMKPGHFVNFTLTRDADHGADNCGSVVVRGMLMRY